MQMATFNFCHAILVTAVLSIPTESENPCEDDQILCRDNSGCIYEDYFCDTTNDCSDGSDEEGCRDLCVLPGVKNSNMTHETSFGHGNSRTIVCSSGYHHKQNTSFTVKCSRGKMSEELPIECTPVPCPEETVFEEEKNVTFPQGVVGESSNSTQTCGKGSREPSLPLANRSCGNKSWDDTINWNDCSPLRLQKEINVFELFMTVVMWVGSLLSVIGLSAYIILLLLVRNLRAKKMSKIHINLFLSLIALYVTILSGNPISPDRSQCKNIATAVQYFSLVTIYWMSIEAVSMYLFVMKYKLPESNKLMLYACAVSYGFPISSVVITYLFTIHRVYQHCFLPNGASLFFGFLIEIFILAVLNIIIFTIVVYKSVFRMFLSTVAQRYKRTELVARIQQFALLWVLLGLSWVICFLSLSTSSRILDMLFCVFGSLQGFILFSFICLKNPEVKNVLVNAGRTLSSKDEHELETLDDKKT